MISVIHADVNVRDKVTVIIGTKTFCIPINTVDIHKKN